MERIANGEVSTYLHNVLMPGDQLEVRRLIAQYFVWEVALGGPLVLIGGGSGVVPLMAMLRHRVRPGIHGADASALQQPNARGCDLPRPARPDG